MSHRQKNLSPLILSDDVAPLLAAFEAAGWPIDEVQLRAIARDNASSNHWKDLIQDYLNSKTADNKKAGKAKPEAAKTAAPTAGSGAEEE